MVILHDVCLLVALAATKFGLDGSGFAELSMILSSYYLSVTLDL